MSGYYGAKCNKPCSPSCTEIGISVTQNDKLFSRYVILWMGHVLAAVMMAPISQIVLGHVALIVLKTVPQISELVMK